MTDYLSSGGIKAPEILANTPKRSSGHVATKDDLYLEGYGRQLNEKMTYSVGLIYGLGLFSGGIYGGLLGVRQGGATTKLFVNSVLNSCSRYGPALANQSAIITMYYVCFSNIIGWVRGADDFGNAAAAGACGGALYKSAARSWVPMAKYSASSCVLFTGVDFMMRGGYI
eukprot:TRINITY_DN69961_c0_g1_i1.p1 TRINITY_DN69961_c0_g1~~TRINITY_DN69961_c0_g1_i1.p1  ORF type:complete len:170 (-),score=36.20 TRINITY_DN69961_c0_g1_i1:170-679(-)